MMMKEDRFYEQRKKIESRREKEEPARQQLVTTNGKEKEKKEGLIPIDYRKRERREKGGPWMDD